MLRLFWWQVPPHNYTRRQSSRTIFPIHFFTSHRFLPKDYCKLPELRFFCDFRCDILLTVLACKKIFAKKNGETGHEPKFHVNTATCMTEKKNNMRQTAQLFYVSYTKIRGKRCKRGFKCLNLWGRSCWADTRVGQTRLLADTLFDLQICSSYDA